MIGSWTLTGYL